jgi:hypothetical protein
MYSINFRHDPTLGLVRDESIGPRNTSTNTLDLKEPENGILLDRLDSAGYENYTEYSE